MGSNGWFYEESDVDLLQKIVLLVNFYNPDSEHTKQRLKLDN